MIGIGISKIFRRKTTGPSYDPDALAYFNAAGITNSNEKTAWNAAVISLKQAGIWNKLKAVYPFLGSDANKTKYNAKSPAAFTITWSGGVTHDSMGVQFNGTDSYGDTGFIEANELTLNDEHISFYDRSGIVDNNPTIGATGTLGAMQRTQLYPNYNVPPEYLIFDMNSAIDPNGRAIGLNGGASTGFFLANRIASNNLRAYRDNTEIASATGANDGALPDFSLFIGANNNQGTANMFCSCDVAFTSIGSGLTTQNVTDFNTIIQTLMTFLGRNI